MRFRHHAARFLGLTLPCGAFSFQSRFYYLEVHGSVISEFNTPKIAEECSNYFSSVGKSMAKLMLFDSNSNDDDSSKHIFSLNVASNSMLRITTLAGGNLIGLQSLRTNRRPRPNNTYRIKKKTVALYR